MTAPELGLTYEELPWSVSPEISHRLGAMQTRRLERTYRAAIPARIAELDLLPLVSREAREAAALATTEITAFDSLMATLPVPMPAILLRTESASSSRIENLTAGARRIAAAEINLDDHGNARLIAANVAAMREAITHPSITNPEDFLHVHRALLEHSEPEIAGRFREEQVWIGGSSLSPHGADFIAPHHSRLPVLLEDLVRFIQARDLPPLIHAAIAHAQFETLHPFTDGNGRVGRALIHSMLTRSIPLASSTIPVSAGLLTDPLGYFSTLSAYREGDPSPIVTAVSNGALTAITNGRILADHLAQIHADWTDAIKARSDSSAWRLAHALFTQPVVNAEFVARHLEVSDPAARNAIATLEGAGILTRSHTRTQRRRNIVWQADAVLAAMDTSAARAGRRR